MVLRQSVEFTAVASDRFVRLAAVRFKVSEAVSGTKSPADISRFTAVVGGRAGIFGAYIGLINQSVNVSKCT